MPHGRHERGGHGGVHRGRLGVHGGVHQALAARESEQARGGRRVRPTGHEPRLRAAAKAARGDRIIENVCDKLLIERLGIALGEIVGYRWRHLELSPHELGGAMERERAFWIGTAL